MCWQYASMISFLRRYGTNLLVSRLCRNSRNRVGGRGGWIVDNFNQFLLFLDMLGSSKFIQNIHMLSAHAMPAWRPLQPCLRVKIWPKIWNQWPQLPTYQWSYYLYETGPFCGLWGHHSLQIASEVRSDPRFEIYGSNCIYVKAGDLMFWCCGFL